MKQADKNLRKYIRLNSCFPVEFSLCSAQDRQISEEQQGFTSNVSEDGLCLRVRNLKPEDEKIVLLKLAKLALSINLPLTGKPIKATAKIVWTKKDDKDSSRRTRLIGLFYQDIDVNLTFYSDIGSSWDYPIFLDPINHPFCPGGDVISMGIEDCPPSGGYFAVSRTKPPDSSRLKNI